MQAGFHNHEFEFAILDNQLIYDALMSRFDPDLVKMQFQTEVINLGYKAPLILINIPEDLFLRICQTGLQIKKKFPSDRESLTGKNFLLQLKRVALKISLLK